MLVQDHPHHSSRTQKGNSTHDLGALLTEGHLRSNSLRLHPQKIHFPSPSIKNGAFAELFKGKWKVVIFTCHSRKLVKFPRFSMEEWRGLLPPVILYLLFLFSIQPLSLYFKTCPLFPRAIQHLHPVCVPTQGFSSVPLSLPQLPTTLKPALFQDR